MTHHAEASSDVAASPAQVFARLDDQRRLGEHMGEPSLMMGGGRMTYELDAGGGQTVGSHIRMGGSAFGLKLDLDEVITERSPPFRKVWRTTGEPRLIVIGEYEMGFALDPKDDGAVLRVWIDYGPPSTGIGRLFPALGAAYARWCVDEMVRDAVRQFGRLESEPTTSGALIKAHSTLPAGRPAGPERRRLAAGLVGLSGAYQVGLGFYFVAVRPPLLPEDARFLGADLATIHGILPNLEPWLNLVFTVLGGQMAAVGAFLIADALRLMRTDLQGARDYVALGAAGVLSVGTMSAVNFALGSDFRWLLVLPLLAWAAGTGLAIASRKGGPRASANTAPMDTSLRH